MAGENQEEKGGGLAPGTTLQGEAQDATPPASQTEGTAYKALETRYAKLEQDFKSLRGGQRGQKRTADELADIRDEMAEMRQVLQAVALPLANGDETLTQKLQVIDQSRATRESRSVQQAQAATIWNRIGRNIARAQEMGKWSDEAVGERAVQFWQTSPEMAPFRQKANDALAKGDLQAFEQVLSDVEDWREGQEDSRKTASQKKAEKDVEEKVKEGLEERGVFSTPTPRAAGSSSPILTMEAWKRMTPEERNANVGRFREAFGGSSG